MNFSGVRVARLINLTEPYPAECTPYPTVASTGDTPLKILPLLS